MISVFSTAYHRKVASAPFAYKEDFAAMNPGAVKRVEKLMRKDSAGASCDLFEEVDALARQYVHLHGALLDATHYRTVKYGEKYRAGEIPKP